MRPFSFRSIGLALTLAMSGGAFLFAQQPAQGQRAAGGTGAARASVAPAVFKVEWVQPAGQTGQVPIVQGNIADPNVEVKWYGEAAKHLLTSGTPGSETTPFTVWSGECDGPFAITFKHKNSMIDMSGSGKIRWVVKTSGFHVVRPVVKLADGTMLVGDHAESHTTTFLESEFTLFDVRWKKLDPERIVTVGTYSPVGDAAAWVANPDLTKVDEVGFADLMPGSGHGSGGWVNVTHVEVYGKAVRRS